MSLQKIIFLLIIINTYSIFQINCSEDPSNQANNTASMPDQGQKEDKKSAQDAYYESKIKRNDISNEIEQYKNSLPHDLKEAALKVGTQIATDTIAQGINYGVRWASGEIQEEKEQKAQNKQYEEEGKVLLREKEKIDIELTQSSALSHKAQERLFKIQAIQGKIEITNNMCSRGIFDSDTCNQKNNALYAELEALFKGSETDNNSEKNDNVTPPNNNASTTDKKENQPNNNTNQRDDQNKPKGDGFWKTLARHFMFAAATAGTMADSIADYSVEYITGHDLFKDTFVNKYKKAINRTVVAVTLYAILHKSYSLYKAYQAERNATEDDIFEDDED